MVNKRFGLGMLVMVLVFGVTVIGCDNGNGTSLDFAHVNVDGTWNGIGDATGVTITISGNNWTITGGGFNDSGTFNRDGDTANLFSGGTMIGTVVITGENSFRISIPEGTFNFTRGQASGDNNNNNGFAIPQEWHMTYTGGFGRTITIGDSFLIFMNMAWLGTILYGTGTLTDMSIEQGGTITLGANGPIGGSYVYLLQDGQRFGLLVHIQGMGRFLGIGNLYNDGAHELISQVQDAGGVFNPPASLSGMPTNFAWGGSNLY